MKLFLLLLSLCVGIVHADETLDIRFLQTQRTKANPFALPFSVNTSGEFSAFGKNGTDIFAFNPLVQFAFSRINIQYSAPIMMDRFNFYPIQKDLGWIEVNRMHIEGGLGISALAKSVVSVGLTPYKGAMKTMVRFRNSKEEKALPFEMPETLNDVLRWNEGDFGNYQMYGGVQFQASVGVSVVDLAVVSMGIQNQFIVEIKKISNAEVLFSISEENLKRRQLVLGPFVTDVTGAQFKGKRATFHFVLNPEDPSHHELFKEGMMGNLDVLQTKLPARAQKLSWEGYDRSFYYGIPMVAGKTRMRGHYDLNEDGEDSALDIRGSSTKGFLTPLRNHDQYVYQTDKHIVMVWASEMNKVTARTMEKTFFSKGRVLGIKGFNREIPNTTKFGSVVSQIGVNLSQDEVEEIKKMDMEEFSTNLEAKCIAESLSCLRDPVRLGLLKDFKKALTKPWSKLRGEFGLLLMKEPALFHTIVKTLKLEKEAYFKFLSEKYQSLEGSGEIEI